MGRVKARKNAKKDESQLLRALYALDDNPNLTLRDAEALYGVPRSTLSDRRSGRTKNRQEAHAHQQKLFPAMEHAIQSWCQDMDDRGFPPRLDLVKGMARALAQQHAEEEGNPDLGYLGKNWITSFLNRHPALASRFSGQLDRQRAKANNPVTLRDYFRKLGRLIHKYKFRPKNTYNMDEKGFILGYSSKAKVVCRAGRRNPLVTQDGTREMLTVLEASAALDYVLPLFVVYKGSAHYMGWHKDTDNPDAKFAYSPNGWTNEKLALEWLRDHFDYFTRAQAGGEPRLLIIDGHGSHLTYKFCAYALANNIHLFCLPPHSTHILQPLDVGLFGPLQHYYGKAADNHMRNTRTGMLKGTFWSFYCEARKQAYTSLNIRAAFRATGIYPFNPDAVLTKLPQPSPLSLDNTNPETFLRTPKTRRDLRHQTNAAVQYVTASNASLGPKGTEKTIALILRLSHLAEKAFTESQIQTIQTQNIQAQYAGKKAAKADRRVISKAQVITGAELIRLRDEREARDAKKLTRKPQKKGSTHAKVPPGRKKITIDPKSAVIVELSDSDLSSHDSFIDIDEFDSRSEYSAPLAQRHTLLTSQTPHNPIFSTPTPTTPDSRTSNHALSRQLRPRI